MDKTRHVSAVAIAAALGWAVPAQAQTADQAAIQQELAQMRADMQRMAQRIDTLEGQLATANAKADSATQAAATASAAATAAAKQQPPVKVAWKGAPEFSTDSGWSFKPRGRMQIDVGNVSAPKNIDVSSDRLGFSGEARRIYIGFDGTIPGGFGYRLEADLAGSNVALTDVYLTYKANKDLTLTVGHQKPFWGLEEMTSDLFTSMTERAAFASAFGFERRLGVSATYATDTVLLQGGVFTDDFAALNADNDKNWSIDGRAVFMPKIGAGRLHIGGSAHFRDLNGSTNSVRYSARPFVHTTDVRFVDTGAFTAVGERSFGGELAYVAGRFHATAEGHVLTVRRAGQPDPTFKGAYGEVGYLLTDDDTAYRGGVYDRIKPRHPVGSGGFGALQINGRYDWLDLTDAGRLGGTQRTASVSLIWVPIDYVRFIANYGHLWLRDAAQTVGGNGDYSADSLGVRAQIDF